MNFFKNPKGTVMCMAMLCAWPFGLSVQAAGYRSLVVEREGGERLSFSLTLQLTVGFNEQALTVRDDGLQVDVSVPREGLKGFHISDEEASLDPVRVEAPGISILPGNAGVQVSNVGSKVAVVEVFDSEGRLVFSSDMTGDCFIPYSVLPHGVNIVKANGCTLKVMVK